MAKTIAYLRISTNHQDLKNQKFEILNYAQGKSIKVDEFVEVEVSSRKDLGTRKISELLDRLQDGDCLIVSELSRIGRSTAEVLNIVNQLIDRKIELHAIKQNMVINGKGDMQTKVMVTMFSLFAELERDLISERTKRALEVKKASGVKLGRPKGSLGKSKLDGKKEIIADLLEKKVSFSSISKIMDVSRGTLYNFISSRHLV